MTTTATAAITPPLTPSSTLPKPLTITPTGSALGAVVEGIDLSRPLSAAHFHKLTQAWQAHHVLIFKGQRLSDAQLFDAITYFGDVFRPPGHIPVLATNDQGFTPDIVKVSNVKGGYTGNGELSAHVDHHWTPRPSKASALYARQIPTSGGDTHWYNLNLGWENLSPDTQRAIESLSLITYNPFVNRDASRPLYREPNNPPKGEAHPHPLVTTHPESGKRLLFLGEATEVEIPELDYASGRALIEELRAHLFTPQHRYEHRWEVGDVVLWDNRATAHYRSAFDENQVRDMRRVSLAGGRPL
ncbi:TauD/TfdA dioxygenase family protein [Halomonas dongshanensis]|uniref:TauD/TfdA family dioxygenase n=1 Tax=Halomonas dongshanensis TaxID=2890835 RepID=A0ABT2EJF5_9GAMM|nr:TauD/TfdA family dioxygenase [Halomonas dongshanensis]MCS2610702.1 TauD/TfdA family dioxygenase [Halomonas dongshanensis]